MLATKILPKDLSRKQEASALEMFVILRENGTNERKASISTKKVSVLQFQVCEHQEHRSQSNLLTAWRSTLKFVIMQWTRYGWPDMTDQLAQTLRELGCLHTGRSKPASTTFIYMGQVHSPRGFTPHPQPLWSSPWERRHLAWHSS